MSEAQRKNRRSIRLPTHDYRQAGFYFVTVCTYRRLCVLGAVIDARMHLSVLGSVVERAWRCIPQRHPHVGLDAYVVMPNHIHGILWLREDAGGTVALRNTGSHRGRGMASHAPTRGMGEPGGMVNHAPTHGVRVPGGMASDASLHSHQSWQSDRVRAFGAPLAGDLGTVVGAFKSSVTREVNRGRGTPGAPFWQRNYYEHVIRNEDDLLGVRRYIEENPPRWHVDADNPDAAARTRPVENLRNE